MSRSRKKSPFYTLNSHHKVRIGKEYCRRKFRNRSKDMLRAGNIELMPLKMGEMLDVWEITDGKIYCPPGLIDEEMKPLFRK